MTPQKPKGEQASADSQVAVARRLLEHALVAHGSHTPKGQCINKILGMLAKDFGKTEDQAESIMPAELKTALMAPAGEPGAPAEGAPPPMQAAA
jgi:hypothetical protein